MKNIIQAMKVRDARARSTKPLIKKSRLQVLASLVEVVVQAVPSKAPPVARRRRDVRPRHRDSHFLFSGRGMIVNFSEAVWFLDSG